MEEGGDVNKKISFASRVVLFGIFIYALINSFVLVFSYNTGDASVYSRNVSFNMYFILSYAIFSLIMFYFRVYLRKVSGIRNILVDIVYFLLPVLILFAVYLRDSESFFLTSFILFSYWVSIGSLYKSAFKLGFVAFPINPIQLLNGAKINIAFLTDLFKSKRSVAVLGGVIIGEPIALVAMIYLASLDPEFKEYVTKIMDNIPRIIIAIFLAFVMPATFLYLGYTDNLISFIRSVFRKKPEPIPVPAGTDLSLKNKVLNNKYGTYFVSGMMIIYSVVLIFYNIIQLRILSFGADYIYNSEYTYSSYAREGLQMLLIFFIMTVIFFSLLRVITVGTKEQKDFMFMKVMNYILIANLALINIFALRKLFIYMDMYGFTNLRIYTFILFLYMFGLFFVYIRASLNNSVYVVYKALNKEVFILFLSFVFISHFLPIDLLVSKLNFSRYVDNAYDKAYYDAELILKTSDESLPVVVEILDDDKIDFNYKLILRNHAYQSIYGNIASQKPSSFNKKNSNPDDNSMTYEEVFSVLERGSNQNVYAYMYEDRFPRSEMGTSEEDVKKYFHNLLDAVSDSRKLLDYELEDGLITRYNRYYKFVSLNDSDSTATEINKNILDGYKKLFIKNKIRAWDISIGSIYYYSNGYIYDYNISNYHSYPEYDSSFYIDSLFREVVCSRALSDNIITTTNSSDVYTHIKCPNNPIIRDGEWYEASKVNTLIPERFTIRYDIRVGSTVKKYNETWIVTPNGFMISNSDLITPIEFGKESNFFYDRSLDKLDYESKEL